MPHENLYIEPEILMGDYLIFKREFDNKHDRLAIGIHDKQGRYGACS